VENTKDADCVIVGGHSLWFKEFFKAFLPRRSDHVAKKKKVRLLPIRPRSRCERRSLRTFPVVTLHPRVPFPAPAAEKAPAAKRAGVQRALTEKEKKMPSDFEIKLGVTEILEKSEQESVSMRKIREQLEARYQTSLADKKAVMKAAVDAYYD
jgi:hypothetical protein